jgi:hypothetical protein
VQHCLVGSEMCIRDSPMGDQWMPCATHGQSNGNTQHNH